jgi:hypothetical protein
VTTSGPARDQVRVDADAVRATVDIHNEKATSSHTIPVQVDRAWQALPGVYQALGLQISQLQEGSRRITGQQVRARGSFAGTRFSRFLNCGETGGAPNAERYDVSMTVATSLQPSGDSTVVSTDVDAFAKPSSTAGAQVRCVANDRIAEVIATRVREAATP